MLVAQGIRAMGFKRALCEFRPSLSKVLTLWHSVKVKQHYHRGRYLDHHSNFFSQLDTIPIWCNYVILQPFQVNGSCRHCICAAALCKTFSSAALSSSNKTYSYWRLDASFLNKYSWQLWKGYIVAHLCIILLMNVGIYAVWYRYHLPNKSHSYNFFVPFGFGES